MQNRNQGSQFKAQKLKQGTPKCVSQKVGPDPEKASAEASPSSPKQLSTVINSEQAIG